VPDGQGGNVATPDSSRSHLPRPKAQSDGNRMTDVYAGQSQHTTVWIMGSLLILLLVRIRSSGVIFASYQVKWPVIRAAGETIDKVGSVLVLSR
jgi:hypothetical protein